MINKYFKQKLDLQIEYNINSSICKNCESEDIRYNGDYYICVKCGLVKEGRIFYQSPDFVNNISYQCRYKRVKYFSKVLRSINGQCVCTVPIDIINIIRKYQFNTIFDLKKIMKTLKLKKYYVSSYYIYRIIKNHNLIDLKGVTMDKMINMFQKIDSCFIELREEYDNKRQNTFQYHYLIRKIFQILDKKEHLQHLNQMKSKDKLRWSERLFEMICNKLNYKFIDEFD